MPTMSVDGIERSLGVKQDAKKPTSCMVEGGGGKESEGGVGQEMRRCVSKSYLTQ